MVQLLPAALYVALYFSTLGICTSSPGSDGNALEPRQTVKRTYKLTDNVVGKGFFDWFEWEAMGSADPTHGRV